MSGSPVVPRDDLLRQTTNLEAPQPIKDANPRDSPPASSEENTNSSHREEDPEEQALESHEVIELQTFSERKAWIEEKIKFLERLPPIEVFAGLDALRDSAEDIPGLPTHEELRQWTVEHDLIEKETEIFDKGELKKLRQLTKAATQRNLSPEDTDLIELTLTTIYALDKLLHLLRDRSDNLDLLGIRLDWEEQRSASWKERRRLLEDLETFLDTRARWSPAVYEGSPPLPSSSTLNVETSPQLSRRGSVASLASIASVGSESSSSLGNVMFNRQARFKVADMLGRDAAQFGARVTTLSHGRVAAAGRLLDKLIDHSRKPVPEVLLDEQDRLDEKCINQMENVNKFVLSLVMQWRKADEIYVESLRDQTSARDLLEDVRVAKDQHPTAAQSAEFLTKLEGLQRRLAVRMNPASPLGGFPRPHHPLFPKQREVNDELAQFLAKEITTATELTQRLEAEVKEYRDNWKAVHQVEILVDNANTLAESFASILKKLNEGVAAETEDGSPPDLTSDECLRPNRHSVFLALLPAIQAEASKAATEANSLVKESQLALYALPSDSVDLAFKANASQVIQNLVSLREQCQQVLDATCQRVSRLREARSVWAAMDVNLKELQYLRDDIVQHMEADCWKQDVNSTGAPPTPESPNLELSPITPSPSNLDAELREVGEKLVQTVDTPLQALVPTLEKELNECLSGKAKAIRTFHDSLLRMNEMLKTVQVQNAVMSSVRDEYNRLLLRMEDAAETFSALADNVLGHDESIRDLGATEDAAKREMAAIQEEVARFVEGLASRVPFVSRHLALSASPNRPAGTFRRTSQGKGDSSSELEDPIAQLPVDLGQLDATVRADSNAYVMRLRGTLDGVTKAARKLDVAQLAQKVDGVVSANSEAVREVEEAFNAFSASAAAIQEGSGEDVDLLKEIDELVERLDGVVGEARPRLARCFSPVRELLRQMDAGAHDFEPSVRQRLYTSRYRAAEEVEGRFREWVRGVTELRSSLGERREAEVKRLEEKKRLEEERKREEEERRRQEEEKRRQEEEEARWREEERKKEEARLEELRRVEEEERLRKEEEAERERLEAERLEAEERRREEEAKEAAAAEARAARERTAQTEAEKTRLLEERHDIEIKLRRAEAQLHEERRLQAERSELALKRAQIEKSQIEEEAKKALLAEQLVREQLLQADAERLKAVEEERQRLEKELAFMRGEHQKVLSERETLSRKQKLSHHRSNLSVVEDDVFGLSSPSSSATDEERQLQAIIYDLRKRLRSLGINDLARPGKSKQGSSDLPTSEQASFLRARFSSLSKEASELPETVAHLTVQAELRSFRMEMESSEQLLDDIDKFARLTEAIAKCDTALSDLLEHIDSYPSPPLTTSGLHTSDKTALPSEQLAARLAFTKTTMEEMQAIFNAVARDSRAIAERTRVHQTWLELEEMANDKAVGGRKSRPVSVTSTNRSSGRNSSASSVMVPTAGQPRSGMTAKKRTSYSNLSVSSINVQGGKLAPPPPNKPSRRAVSGGGEKSDHGHRRSSSRVSMSSSRSVSGPGPTQPVPMSASVMAPTFASRQRTSSITSLSGSRGTPVQGRDTPVARPRAAQSRQVRSPSVSEVTSRTRSSFAVPAPPRTTKTSGSTWARAPRNSLSSIMPRAPTPKGGSSAAPPPRKKYIADPKSKLDVAVGDVVNQLPVGINVEGVAETWKDQSGKYWIGNQDPKLCFCRILRSQTVMVRVGGGWSELSKFIKDHFAESFRLVPESPPRASGKQEEKWISSATLISQASAEQRETSESPLTMFPPPAPPKTPEPKAPSAFVPSFAISTPSGHSPRSLLSSPGSGSAKGTSSSPLTALQFIRRADPADPSLLRPGTPSKSSRSTSRQRSYNPSLSTGTTTSRASVWRP